MAASACQKFQLEDILSHICDVNIKIGILFGEI